MTMTRPLRLMILHLSHIFLTDGLTFILGPPCLLESIGNPAVIEVVGGKLHCDSIAGQYTDEIHTHFPGYMCQDDMSVFQFDAEHGIG